LTETARNLEKTLKEDIQHLNKCIVDKNAKISTLELFFKTYSDDLKKKYHELEIVFKRAKDEVTLFNKLLIFFMFLIEMVLLSYADYHHKCRPLHILTEKNIII